MNQDLNSRFALAIEEKNIPWARDLATQFDTIGTLNEQTRKSAYRQVMHLALQEGEGMAATEVAPFAEYRITADEYEKCMEVALDQGKYAEVIWCSKRCGKIPNLLTSTLALSMNSSAEQFFRDVVFRHIDEEDLPPKERLLLWLHRNAAVRL